MPSLQVREVPAMVYGALADAAKREHRSLGQQALLTLERGLGVEDDPRQRRRRLIERIREAVVEPPEELPEPAVLIREDRER